MSFQSLTIHRNLIQVYEHFNWIVWAVSYFYFYNPFSSNKFGLPPQDNDAWIEGFTWKGIYFRLLPLEQIHLIKDEIDALKHINLELEEWLSLEERYRGRFKIETKNSYHKKVIPPLLSLSECGGYAIYGWAEIPIHKADKGSPAAWIKNLQANESINLSKSMLQLMPYLSKLTPSNLVPLSINGIDDKYIIVNAHQIIQPYLQNLYSKWIIRIPQDNTEEISIYSYPTEDSLLLESLISLFVYARFEDNEDSPRKPSSRIAKEKDNIRECNFTAHGCKMKILLYDSENNSSNGVNERAKAVFMTRDERILRMSMIKAVPPAIKCMVSYLFENNIIGESESIWGNVLLIVEQYVQKYCLPYSLTYNKPVRKPELYIERAIDRAKEILEVTNDICSDIALKEFLNRKGLDLSSIWIFSALIKSKLLRQLCMWILLAEGIKKLINKETFILSIIQGSEKIPGGLTSNKNGDNSPIFKNSFIYIVEWIINKKFEEENRVFKTLLMILFFYRLESLQFYNSLQFESGTKDYLQGKYILDDIIHVASENPWMFLKILQNSMNVKFSNELLRKWSVDKYSFIYNENPLSAEYENEENEKNLNPVIINQSPVSVRERMYFIMAKFISTKEYQNALKERDESSKSMDDSRYSTPNRDSNNEDENDSDDEGDNESNNDSGSYESNDSFNKENSPPYKQAKFDRSNTKGLNPIYSGRVSVSSNHDNIIRASHADTKMGSNFIDNSNSYKKCQYIWK